MTKITKYIHSAVLIEHKNKRILIDPGCYCYSENFSANDWGKVDILLITHSHKDHFVIEAVGTIRQNNPNLVIFSTKAIEEVLSKENIDCEVLNPDEEKLVDGIKIKGVKQAHGDLPSGDPRPDVIGFLIDDKFYHPGDTIYMEEKPKTEVLFVPFNGIVTMDIKEAAKFSKEINPKIIIPIHYNSPKFPVDVNDFVKEMEGYNVKVLKNGESIEIE
ncbi:MAG: MBL fold metallo-hydrolase [Candidatus Paceibacterota bacterium]|jgi:L-ascorbate metabolism protein UlaG (beta-lactamase superfamily)